MSKIATLFLLCAALTAHAQQAPPIEWQRCLGGSAADQGTAIELTADGGFIVVGSSGSADGDLTANHGGSDLWIVKLDSGGNIVWQRNLGGSGNDAGRSVQETLDGGYIVAGNTTSNDGDVLGHHGGPDPYDAWVVKLDSLGELQWQRCLGGLSNDWGQDIRPTTDGGYVLLGSTLSNGGDVSGNHGGFDIWVVKLDAGGAIEWQRCLGGSGNDSGRAIRQTTDGGYVLVGNTSSNDGDVSGLHGGSDVWVVKLDPAGEPQWQRCLGGSALDIGLAMELAPDGGYIVAGRTGSDDGDVTGFHGGGDGWAVKLDPSGVLEWQLCVGGSDLEELFAVDVLADGYVLAGITYSNDGDVTDHQGAMDIWVVRLQADGSMAWQRTLGGTGNDIGLSVRALVDGGMAVAGGTVSADGDVTCHIGGGDLWLVKLGAEHTAIADLPGSTARFAIHPNPTRGELIASISTPVHAEVGLHLFDVASRPLRTLYRGWMPAGGRELRFSIEDLPAGIYFLRAEVGGRSTTQKVVKL
ncbi:MAG: T9SS type A sorting domain-containing protein [Flavobacteriales bacterium]|jgi:hypothetical protein|nr:T9SS type A sorting domain-containing protein [Flavobacteriales bacterium]